MTTECIALEMILVSDHLASGSASRTAAKLPWTWLPLLPADWPLVRLGHICRLQNGLTIDSARDISGDVVTRPYLRVANVQAGNLSLDSVTEITMPRVMAERSTLRYGDVLMTEGGDLDKLGRGTVWRDELPNCLHQNHVFALRPDQNRLDVDYLALVTQSLHGRCYFESTGTKTTNLASTNSSKILDFPVPLPPLDEQRRIVDFLDAETARIDQLMSLREKQIDQLEGRVRQLIDGAVVGELDALKTLGFPGDTEAWRPTTVARQCEIIPGYSFPSDGFVSIGEGVRLLRGINVAVDRIDWSDTVAWNLQFRQIPGRFHLRFGDLVMGMDRPWISKGMRLALVGHSDVPALLLQRVACLRSKGESSLQYMRWVLSSSHFRWSVESELTGVSVPHISGEQIGKFVFRAPTGSEQSLIADALDMQAVTTAELKARIKRAIKLLSERRQALITAAVTGQVDVTTARGAV